MIQLGVSGKTRCSVHLHELEGQSKRREKERGWGDWGWSYLQQPRTEVVIQQDIKAKDLEELALLLFLSAWTASLIGVDQVR